MATHDRSGTWPLAASPAELGHSRRQQTSLNIHSLLSHIVQQHLELTPRRDIRAEQHHGAPDAIMPRRGNVPRASAFPRHRQRRGLASFERRRVPEYGGQPG